MIGYLSFFYFPLNPFWIAMVGPALILSLLATLLVRGTFARYSQIRVRRGISGAEAARYVLDQQGLQEVKIERTEGFLSDHYDPTENVLRLSPGVYEGRSISSVGVACHEAGHAVQKAVGYTPLALRHLMVPAAQFGPMLAVILFLISIATHSLGLAWLGVILFSTAFVFSIITLPVEFNASSRARVMLLESGLITMDEEQMVGSVLNAAAMTYVAAAVYSLMELLYWMMQLGLLGNRRG